MWCRMFDDVEVENEVLSFVLVQGKIKKIKRP